MTYCLAALVDEGLVFVSDSRTTAGTDQINTYGKLHRFRGASGKQVYVVLSAGNLATTQAVVTRLQRDQEAGAADNLNTFAHMSEAAEYVGAISREERKKYEEADSDSKFSPEATFILGGQIGDDPPRLFLIYPEGNYIRPSTHSGLVMTPCMPLPEWSRNTVPLPASIGQWPIGAGSATAPPAAGALPVSGRPPVDAAGNEPSPFSNNVLTCSVL